MIVALTIGSKTRSILPPGQSLGVVTGCSVPSSITTRSTTWGAGAMRRRGAARARPAAGRARGPGAGVGAGVRGPVPHPHPGGDVGRGGDEAEAGLALQPLP